MPEYDKKTIEEFAKLMDELSLTEIEYGKGDWHIRLSRAARPAVAAPEKTDQASAQTPAVDKSVDDKNVVKSPMLGVVYASPDPDSPPYVKIGDTVAEDQTLFLIEAMKTFNPVKAPRAGKVVDILVKDRHAVEFDEPLLILE